MIATRAAIATALLCAAIIILAMHLAHAQSGMASYYAEGQRVACGGRFDPSAMTAASPNLPCGARVRVTNSRNGRSVVLTINDRGPARWTHRIIDVSRGAAGVLGMIQAGVVPVTVDRE